MTDVSMWMALESAMQQDGKQRRSVSRETVRRVAAFAKPHLRTIVAFLVLATGSAVLGVASSRVGRTGGQRDRRGARHGHRGRAGDLDRGHRRRRLGRRTPRTAPVVTTRRRTHPRPATTGVRARAEHADRVLHPHPHGRAGQPSEQRRDRRPTGVHVGVVGRRHQRHRPRPHGCRDAEPVVADHGAGARVAPSLRDPRPPGRCQGRCARTRGDRAQRGDDIADDRTLLGAGRDAGQAVRATDR